MLAIEDWVVLESAMLDPMVRLRQVRPLTPLETESAWRKCLVTYIRPIHRRAVLFIFHSRRV